MSVLKTFCRISVAMAVAGALAGCGSGGFQPLYGSLGASGGSTVQAELASLDVAPIPGRVGQRIRNELLFQASGGAAPDNTSNNERVDIVIRETNTSTLVNVEGNSLGQIYQLEAAFRIYDKTSKKVVFEGRSIGRAGFERYESIYSNVRAREDAENRAAAVVGTDLRTQLAAYISRRRTQ